eukprot:3759912-Amphidinium_carterae.1
MAFINMLLTFYKIPRQAQAKLLFPPAVMIATHGDGRTCAQCRGSLAQLTLSCIRWALSTALCELEKRSCSMRVQDHQACSDR